MRNKFTSYIILSILFTGLVWPVKISGQQNNRILEELEKLGLCSYFDIIYSTVEENILLPDWKTYYFDSNDCKCVFGQEYFLFARDNGGKNKNLVFALQGGGACWPGMEACKTEVTMDDVYNAEYHYRNKQSPVKEWNFIFLPYCDGSVHMGDNEADYNGDGTIDYWHWGLHSTSAAAVLAKQLYPEVEKIYITGCSAGGYGTFIATLLMRFQYPGASIYVMNESGPGLSNPEDLETWEIIKSTWNIASLFPDDCEKCDGQQIFLYEWMLNYDPNLKIGLYSSYKDKVIGEEYLKMKPKEFRRHLMRTSGAINEAFPQRFKRFFVKGRSHCVDDYAHEIDGTRMSEWIEQLISDDPGWKDLLE